MRSAAIVVLVTATLYCAPVLLLGDKNKVEFAAMFGIAFVISTVLWSAGRKSRK